MIFVLFLVYMAASKPCNMTNLSYAFGPCDEATRTKRVYFYWKEECEGGIELPKPVNG